MTQLRILYVHNSADLYGASRSLVRLLKRIDRNRFVPLVILPNQGPLQSLIESLGVEVIVDSRLSIITRPVFRSWRLILFLLQFPVSVLFLQRLIRQKNIHLVHTNTGVVLSSGLAARLARVPHIWHIRDWFQEFKSFWKPYSFYICWASKLIIAVSQAVASQFSNREKIRVIHNGFTLEEFNVPKEILAQQFREQRGLGNEFLVGCVGRIKLVRKGQEVLVRAAALLKKKGLRSKYVIVGSPFPGNEGHLLEIKNLISRFGLDDAFIMTGELEDVKPAYSAMNVLVLPSSQPEPFGGVVMEAMAMGVPVIATNIGGSTDQVADGVTGFLVPPSDPQALADKIELLMQDPELRLTMSREGPKRIAQNFSIEVMIQRIQDLYEVAVDGAQPACDKS